MNKQVVVLCMHRSGSSAVAGILHYLGVDMGRGHYMPASKDNPKGYWEDLRFVMLNQKILMMAGGNWNVNLSYDAIMAVKPKVDKHIRSLVESRSGLWGWKDPRTVLVWPLYEPYIENPHFVVSVRPCGDIALSLNRRDRMPFEQGVKFATDYYRRIRRITDGAPNVNSVMYDDLVRTPRAFARKLASDILADAVPDDFIYQRG